MRQMTLTTTPSRQLMEMSTAGVEMKFKNMHYPVLIAATHVRELSIIRQTNAGLCVGASVTLATLDQALKQAIEQHDGNI